MFTLRVNFAVGVKYRFLPLNAQRCCLQYIFLTTATGTFTFYTYILLENSNTFYFVLLSYVIKNSCYSLSTIYAVKNI